MMKKVFALVLAATISLGLSAQSVQETVAAIGDLSVPACNVSLQKDVKLVKGAMEQYLKEANLKTKNVEGYVAALQQVVSTVSPAAVSLYTKVEEQGKKKDRSTVVTVAVIGNDLTIDQAELRDNAKTWLANFVQYISRYEAQQQMNAEQKNLDKANKAAAKAASELASVNKAIEKDQKKIADKKKEIEKLKDKIKDCENDIKDLQSDIEKQNKKKGEAQQKVNETQQGVSNAQGEVDRYRQLAQ